MATDSTQQHAGAADNPALIRIAQAEFLYKDALSTFATSLVAAITIIPVYYSVAPPALLFGWFVFFSLITAGRYTLSRIYRTRLRELERANHAIYCFMGGTMASGLAWGISALVFVPFETLTQAQHLLYTCFYVMYCIALTAGCVAHYAVYKPIWYSFAIPCMIPPFLMLMLSGELVYSIIALLMLVYLIFISISVHKINDTILTSLLLRLEKSDLSRYLEQERQQVYSLNEELRRDIDKRKQTEEELLEAKTEAERLAAELLNLSNQDGLTGIPNRRAFDQCLQDEWHRATRQQSVISLIICDIDHYKSYNDYYGHQRGDETLIRIGQTLQQSTRREGEMAARYGGEEFAIVLANANLDTARELAEQMREAVLKLRIPHIGSAPTQHLTVSFGVSSIMPVVGMTTSVLINTADHALYEAKARGRNCVVTRMANSDSIKDNAPGYATQPSANTMQDKHDETTMKPNTDQVQLQRWDNTLSLSEILMRKKLESQGFTCNRYDYPPGMVFPEHSHEVDKIDAVLTGQFRVTVGDQEFDLLPGDALYIPRHVTHRAEVIGNETVTSLDGVKQS